MFYYESYDDSTCCECIYDRDEYEPGCTCPGCTCRDEYTEDDESSIVEETIGFILPTYLQIFKEC